MHRYYIVTSTRGGKQLPSFFLDAWVQGIVDAGHAARVALDILGNAAAITYLREDMAGNLEATAYGTRFVIYAAAAEDLETAYPGPGADLRARIARADPADPWGIYAPVATGDELVADTDASTDMTRSLVGDPDPLYVDEAVAL